MRKFDKIMSLTIISLIVIGVSAKSYEITCSAIKDEELVLNANEEQQWSYVSEDSKGIIDSFLKLTYSTILWVKLSYTRVDNECSILHGISYYRSYEESSEKYLAYENSRYLRFEPQSRYVSASTIKGLENSIVKTYEAVPIQIRDIEYESIKKEKMDVEKVPLTNTLVLSLLMMLGIRRKLNSKLKRSLKKN